MFTTDVGTFQMLAHFNQFDCTAVAMPMFVIVPLLSGTSLFITLQFMSVAFCCFLRLRYS